MKLAIVGATGMVGGVMREVLAERKLPISELILVASARSAGKKITFEGKEYTVVTMQDAIAKQPDIAIFSAGGITSKEWAPKFAEVGTFVIDNSSAWRMDPNKLLVVPEINADLITEKDRIIANPNCSTIQLVVALHDLHREYEIERMVISTYQSVTGTGVSAVRQLNEERSIGKATAPAYPHPIDKNCFPHGGDFLENGYTSEEMKLVHETRKIYNSPDIKITATVVRIPVVGGHSEAVNISFKKPITIEGVNEVLRATPGVTVLDDPENNAYPMPLYAEGKDDVFVGRIRKDESHDNAIDLWIVSDNLRKGAATNAVQIAQYLIKNNIIAPVTV
ncbi:MAG: aspartate-semialdehyde dehydrogenase [Saprospiraceae bacterium]|jgi:aspartate-semialdehyde dehydrogenase